MHPSPKMKNASVSGARVSPDNKFVKAKTMNTERTDYAAVFSEKLDKNGAGDDIISRWKDITSNYSADEMRCNDDTLLDRVKHTLRCLAIAMDPGPSRRNYVEAVNSVDTKNYDKGLDALASYVITNKII